ncbi:MAG: glutamyl-tRNA reductase [Microbacteriaceae bacterium]|nr:glutamyl-tRNA reductase [Microbacteriaceae bacterium]
MLICVSVSHRTTGFDLLDRLSAATADDAAAELLGRDTAGAVLLSTCNRVEAYADVEAGAEAQATARIVRRFAAAAGLSAEEFQANAMVASGPEALQHLFAVTAGLESLAVGEDEIAGQVRRAYDAARVAGATTPALDRAFQRASKVSREVRSATELGRQGRSLVQFALDLAGHRVTDWRAARVLVVGTGNYAATTIAGLRALGVADIAVYSKTGRAGTFAAKYGVTARGDLAGAIAAAEVVITCTRAYTVAPADVPADGARRLVIDLGMPRNVEPGVGELPGIELLDLQLIALHADLPELAPATPEAAARRIVQSATGRFTAEQLAAPAIVALRRHIFDALDAEIERAESRAATPEAAAAATEALRHLAGVLLHTPSERARDAAAVGGIADFEAALAVVYGIDPSAHDEHRVMPLHFADLMREAEAQAAAAEQAARRDGTSGDAVTR